MVKVLENVFRGIICSFAVNNWSNLWPMILKPDVCIFSGRHICAPRRRVFKRIYKLIVLTRYLWVSWRKRNRRNYVILPLARVLTRTRDCQPAHAISNQYPRLPTRNHQSNSFFPHQFFPPRSTIWTRGTVHSDHDVATDVWRKRKIQYICCKLHRGRWHKQNARSPRDFSLNFLSLAIFEFQKFSFSKQRH